MKGGPSAQLAAHAGAVALSGLIGAAFWLAAIGALLCGRYGAALALGGLAIGARAARPGPTAALDRETGR